MFGLRKHRKGTTELQKEHWLVLGIKTRELEKDNNRMKFQFFTNKDNYP